RVPRLRRTHPPGGGPAAGAGRPGSEAVLLPPDDPVPCRVDRRGPSLRLSDRLRPTLKEGFYRRRPSSRPAGPWGSLVWARGPRVIRPTGNPTSLGCWRLRFKSGRTHTHGEMDWNSGTTR